MKSILLLLFLSFSTTVFAQQAITTFILTRHAEKGDDGTKDPDLTPQGNERALSLVKLLNETKIDAVYSTSYKRTRNTVLPLATAKGLSIRGYEAFETGELDAMLKTHAGGTIMISGHSNNIPWIVNYLMGREDYKNFDDTDYSNLIIVNVVERGKAAKVTWLNY